MKFPILIEGWFRNPGPNQYHDRVRLVNSLEDLPIKSRFQIVLEDANEEHLKALKAFLDSTDDGSETDDDIPF